MVKYKHHVSRDLFTTVPPKPGTVPGHIVDIPFFND